MFSTNDLSEQYLNKLYEDFSKESMRLLTVMKNGGEAEEKQKEIDTQKQITLLNTLMIGILRFRNIRKAISQKINL